MCIINHSRKLCNLSRVSSRFFPKRNWCTNLVATGRVINVVMYPFFQLHATLDDLNKGRGSSPTRNYNQASPSPRNFPRGKLATGQLNERGDHNQAVKLPQNVTEAQWLELKQQLAEQENLISGEFDAEVLIALLFLLFMIRLNGKTNRWKINYFVFRRAGLVLRCNDGLS